MMCGDRTCGDHHSSRRCPPEGRYTFHSTRSPPEKLLSTRRSHMTPLESLIATGTKLWLDSIDPELVVTNRQFGATGATSNPIIVGDLIKTGRFDKQLTDLM